jgi:beta-glucanase (GH16 family)
MTWSHPQKYGRWEIRARFPAGCGCYHPVILLWPVSHPWPAGGEVDYAEVLDGNRQKLNFFLHHGAENRQDWSGLPVDMTRWHNYAVEWTPYHIVGFIDGHPFFQNTAPEAQPPGLMNQVVQLDWFPDGTGAGAVIEVDWAAIYQL